ncbi:MAG: hypothetical protein AAF092_13170 [Pseudomonadota bacterium]
MRTLALTAPILLTACGSVSVSDNDKGVHMLAGGLVSHYVTERTGSQWQGCAAALSVGILKEAIDRQGSGVADSKDALATGAGCSITYRF